MSIPMHAKKRVEIIVEAPVLTRVLSVLDEAGVTGYTVLPALSGRGHAGHWTRDDSFNNASHMVSIVCIADASVAERAVQAVYAVVAAQIGILSVTDVHVVRKDHF